jgi:signal transduction histidine kinase/ActR/RegA family two-component response regulator
MGREVEQGEPLERELLARAEAESARAEAESAQSRLFFLAEASRILGSSLDYETTLRNLARLAVPQLADSCVVDLADEGQRIRRVAVADIDPKREELVWRAAHRHPLGAHDPPSCARVISTGEPEWLPEIAGEMRFAAPENESDPDLIRSLGFRSFICVPLPVHGQILGSISVARCAPGKNYDSADLVLLEELARRAGLAVDHARLYRTAQETNRIKDEFLTTLSHELRSPLSSALLCTQMLRRGVLDPVKAKAALETIERNIALEVRLVDDLVDISRITSGKLSLAIETISLASVVHAAVEGARSAAEAQGIRLDLVFDDLEVQVQGDAARLQQVMSNLLSNAIKFTPKGGRVDVRLSRAGLEAKITVRDTGIGISPKLLPEIFERFRQLDTSPARRYGGLGLGLAIVRQLVGLHGGVVTAESSGEGRGAALTVMLPVVPSGTHFDLPPSTEGQDDSDESDDLDEVRVLVVDDDADARESMANVLVSHGATVTTAASASQALEVFRRGDKQDVLVSDISMPEVDGYELLREMRTRKSRSGAIVPAIAVTAYASVADRERALAAGYRLHLSKPIDQGSLVAAVADLAGRRKHGTGKNQA